MQIINHVLPGDDCNLFLFSCVHTGSLMSHETGFQRMVEMVNSPYDWLDAKYNRAIDHGDMIEAIEIKDKRFCMETTKIVSIGKQRDRAVELRKPLGKKLITCLKGNHENAVSRIINPAEEICEKLEIRYGTYSAVINYLDKKGRPMFKHYITHGNGSIRSDADDPVRQKSNTQLSLKRKLKNKFGDCLLNSCGHFHKLITVKPLPLLYLTTEGQEITHNYTEPRKKSGYIEPNHKFYASCGSFHKLYELGVDSYAERANYDPVELGFVIAKKRNGTVADLVEVAI